MTPENLLQHVLSAWAMRGLPQKVTPMSRSVVLFVCAWVGEGQNNIDGDR